MLDPLSFSIATAQPQPNLPRLPRRFLLEPCEGSPDDYTLSLDYSHGLSAFMECQRRWENINIHAREANKPSAAKDFGTAFHLCEEMRLRGVGEGKDLLSEQRSAALSFFQKHPVPAEEYRHAERLLSVLDQYNRTNLNKDGWEEQVYIHQGQRAVEIPFKIELATLPVNADLPFTADQLISPAHHATRAWYKETKASFYVRNLHILYTGKIDAILEDVSGLLWVVDHKTSSRGGWEFENAFRLSLQTRGYCWAAQKIIDREVSGLIMNAVIVRPLTKTGTGTEFARHTFLYSQDSLREWEQNAISIVEDIVASLQRGYFPQTGARSFKSACVSCDFADNCSLPPSQRAADLASELYLDVTWSPTSEL